MRKKLAAALAVMVVASACLTACSKTDTDAATAETATAETATGETAAIEYDLGLDDDGYFRNVTASKYIKMPKNYEKYTVSKDVYTVTDDAIQKELDAFQNNYNLTTEVTGRAAQNGDVVNIAYEGTVDGVAFTGGTSEDYGDGVKAAVKQTAVILNSSGEYTISEDWAAQAASNDEANQTSSLIAAGLVLGICYLLLGYTFWLNWPETKENFYNLWKSGKFKPFKEKKRQEILTKEAKEAEEREKERKRQEEEERKLIEREQRRAEKEAKEAEEREKEREHREEKERKPTKRKRHRVEKGARRRKESQKGETNTFDTSSKPSEQEEKKPNATPIIGGATLTYAMLHQQNQSTKDSDDDNSSFGSSFGGSFGGSWGGGSSGGGGATGGW